MKWLTFKVQQEAGFRFNLRDLIFILILGIFSLVLKISMPEVSLFALPLYLGFTFFLFCNVFRIGNRAEIWWYIPFLIAAIITIHTMQLEELWWIVLFFFEPLKIILIISAMRNQNYHGVFQKK